MDLFDEIFSAMRVESALYARLEATAPWGVDFIGGPGANFGLVVRGSAWLTIQGLAQPLGLAAGDCYIVAPQTPYTLSDNVRSATRSCTDVIHGKEGGIVSFGGGGTPTDIVGGWFTFDALSAEPLISVLPPVLRIGMDSERALALQSTLQLIAMETAVPSLGSKLVVSRLADILFIQAMRTYVSSCACAKKGWLAAYADRRLSAVMHAMHADIGRDWTVETLADAAHMSRSAFALKFKAVLGETPLGYLTNWRMYKAKCLLRQHDSALGEIALAVGYDSDASFSRVFKRWVGATPGEYRRRQQERYV